MPILPVVFCQGQMAFATPVGRAHLLAWCTAYAILLAQNRHGQPSGLPLGTPLREGHGGHSGR